MGYEDGSLRLWDLKQGNAIYVIKGNSYSMYYSLSSVHLQLNFKIATKWSHFEAHFATPAGVSKFSSRSCSVLFDYTLPFL